MPLCNVLQSLRVVQFELRFEQPASFHWFHGNALYAFLQTLLGRPAVFPKQLRPDAVESGRVRYGPGEPYYFGMVVLPGGDALANAILRALKQPACVKAEWKPPMPLRDNVTYVSLRDLVGGRTVERVDEAAPLGIQRVEQSVVGWSAVEDFRIRMRSPMRIERATGARGEFLRENNFDLTRFLGQVDLSVRSTVSLITGENPHAMPSLVTPAWGMPATRLLWIDAPRRDANADLKILGGLCGSIEVHAPGGIGPDWAERLVLAQYTGVGMSPNFGLGRIRLERPDGSHEAAHARPSRTFFDRAFARGTLQQARADAIQRGGVPGIDGEGVDEWTEDPTLLDRLEGEIARQEYKSRDLLGVLIPKAGGGSRALAIPTVRDRVAQRATVRALRDGIEQLFEDSSFAYRRGLSRANAARQIAKLRDAGYCYVLDADIDSFFDNVKWADIDARLEAVLGPDEPLLPMIQPWIHAPVWYRDHRLERRGGLPQGAPISPLLANLLLDRFDEQMDSLGFRLVRYADDFIVLCKSPEDAERARQQAEVLLAELGLKFNDEKTAVTDFDRGFRYLGYLFAGSLITDSDSDPAEHVTDRVTTERPEFPDWPWLPDSAPQPIELLKERMEQVAETPEPFPLLILPPPAKIASRGGTLWIQRKGSVDSTPWPHVSEIVAFGIHHFTGHAERDAMRRSIPIQWIGEGGAPLGALVSSGAITPGGDAPWKLWLAQAAAVENPALRLSFAREVVATRVSNILVMLARIDEQATVQSIRTKVHALIPGIAAAPDLDQLRGLEGSATRELFQAIGQLVRPSFSFLQRTRRPPKDPINALLSLGYTMMYAHISNAISREGLLPWIGLYHESGGTHAALASDLVEEFRYLVETLVLRLVRRRQLTPADFSPGYRRGVYLSSEARKLFVTELQLVLDREVSESRGGPTTTYRKLLSRQSRRVAALIRRGEPYEGWRAR